MSVAAMEENMQFCFQGEQIIINIFKFQFEWNKDMTKKKPNIFFLNSKSV